MINFGIIPQLIDTVDLIARISGIKLELSQIDDFERRLDIQIADYINGKDGFLDESDRATIETIRTVIAQERRVLQASLSALARLQTLEQDFPNLPRQ